MTDAAEQLQRFRTGDLDVARERISEAFADHSARVADGRRLDFRLDLAPAHRITLGRLGYGADVTLDGPPMRACYHVNLPVAGCTEVSQAGRSGTTVAGRSGVAFGPDAPLRIRFSPDATQYVVKLPRDLLEAHAAKLLGRPPGASLDLALTFDTTTGPGQALVATAGFLYAELARPGGLATMPAARAEMEAALMTQLLTAIPNAVTAALAGRAAPAGRSRVREALDLLDSRPDAITSTADLAAAVGIGERALQAGFRDAVGCSPMTYLRGVRLDQVRAELSAGAGSVTEVAGRWGFFHPGRFAAQYRDRFGERPSDTIRHIAG